MKNLINTIFLVTLLFFIPVFSKGKSTEGKSFIQTIKEKITKEAEKIEEKSEEKEKEQEKEKDKDMDKDKDKK